MSLDRTLVFLEKTDGRDKVLKALSNWCKTLAWYYTVTPLTLKTPKGATDAAKKAVRAQQKAMRESAAMYKKMGSSFSKGRQLTKFFKWLKAIREIRDALANGPGDMSAGDWVGVLSDFCDIWYKVFDNIEWLADHKVIKYDVALAEKRSKEFQFWCYFFAIIVSFKAFLEKRNSDDAKKRKKVTLDLIKDGSDFLRVCATRGVIPKLPAAVVPPFAGLMGTISGSVGSYQVWLKCK